MSTVGQEVFMVVILAEGPLQCISKMINFRGHWPHGWHASTHTEVAMIRFHGMSPTVNVAKMFISAKISCPTVTRSHV